MMNVLNKDMKRLIEMTDAEIVAIVRAAEAGEAECYGRSTSKWRPCGSNIIITGGVYRIKPSKPSIDWSHVDPRLKWLARDADGQTYLYEDMPELVAACFDGSDCDWVYVNDVFASYKPGTCDWRDSLVKRPEGGEPGGCEPGAD